MYSSCVVVEMLIVVGVVRVIVTVNEPLLVLLRVSLLEQFTVVVPTWKFVPEAGLQVTGRGPSTASLAVAVNVTVLPNGSVVESVMFAGRLSTGPAVSWTVTVNDAVAVLAPSLAVQLTVVVPMPNVLPGAGTQLAVTV